MTFRAKKRISERNAYNMIVTMALYGNHYNDIHGHIRGVANIKDHYSQNGQEFKRVVAECRDFSRSVPIYENLLGAQWSAEGVIVSKASHITGEYEPVLSGEGVYNESDYWANFEISKEDFEQAITTGRWERFLSAVNAGIAAIEAFLNHQYMVRLRVGSEGQELRDNIEAKAKTWPTRLVGQPLDLSGRSWASFLKLKALRDEGFQHRKSVSSGVTRAEHLAMLNEFKHAIPRLLLDMHIHFRIRCPSAIIRYSYFPEVERAG